MKPCKRQTESKCTSDTKYTKQLDARHHLIVKPKKSILSKKWRNHEIEPSFNDYEENLKMAKSFGLRQPAQSAQADIVRYFPHMYLDPISRA